MPSWQETIIISSGMLRKFYGEVLACADSGDAHVAIWPQFNSGGLRAEFVIIRPAADVYMGVDEPEGIGASVLVGMLEDDTNYAFPIHPKAHTLHFRSVSGDCNVQVNWIVGR
jgi:hypothetical protein